MSGGEAPAGAEAPKPRPKPLPAFSEKKLRKLQENHDRRGIVYISRIPPHLKPQKLRQMLEQYAEVGRVYLAPEDPLLRKKRKQSGGNSGKNFTEGWVEFEDKGKAKEVVAMLNGQPMGGKRRSAYFYDLWTLKYLPRFKWDHLTEEVTYQKAVREQRLAAEISAAKRERDFYLSRVDRAKAQTAMQERKRKRGEAAGGDAGVAQAPIEGAAAAAGGDGDGRPAKQRRSGSAAQQQQQEQQEQQQDAAGGAAAPGGLRVMRTYGQRRPKADPVTDAAAPKLSAGLLKLIAGSKRGDGD